MWQLIDDELEEQSAVTIWRTVSTAPLETAMNSTVSMVELKPKTGRFHQLRRHMVSNLMDQYVYLYSGVCIYNHSQQHRLGYVNVQSSGTVPMMVQAKQ